MAKTELDYMEYSSDALAQAAYVSSDGIPLSHTEPTDLTDQLWLKEGNYYSQSNLAEGGGKLKLAVEWAHRRKITIDKTKIDAQLTHFPITLFLGESVGTNNKDVHSIFNEIGENFKKIAITQADGQTQLYCEIELWDSTNKKAVIHISREGWNIASDTDTDIYIYYDNTHPDNDDYIGVTQSTPAKNVWDSDFVARWDKKDKTTSTIEDSTVNANHGTKKGANEPLQDDGKVGKAQNYDGVDDYVSIANHTTLNPTRITIGFWVNLPDSQEAKNAYPTAIAKDAAGQRSWSVWITYKYRQIRFYLNGVGNVLNFTENFDGIGWVYVAAVYDGSYIRLYKNGVEVDNTPATGDIDTTTSPIYIGTGLGATGDRFQNGLIDEVRICKQALSAAWIKATYNSGNDSLVSWGDEENNFYFSSGHRISNPLSLDTIKGLSTSKINWTESKPANTNIKNYTEIKNTNIPSTLDSANWKEETNGGAITGASGDMTGKYLHVMQKLSTTAPASTPELEELSVNLGSLGSYSENVIKTQDSYALKGVATTEAINKTLTRTISSPIDLTGQGAIKFDIRSSRTGSNIKIGIRDSGGTTTETTPNIASADTYQRVIWDISGVSDANKDAIDQIIITIVNADSANTFYIDNMFAGGEGLVQCYIL